MAETNRDNEIREEIKRAKKEQRRHASGGAKRWIWMLLVFVLVLGAVGYAAYNGLDSVDSMRRLFSYSKVSQDEHGKAELFRFDNDRTAQYVPLGKGLLIVSTTRVQLLGEDGAEVYSRTVNFNNPAVVTSGQTAVVYNVGGTELYVFSRHGLARDMSGESGNGILSVSLNASGYMALTTLKSGTRAAVTAYDASGAPVFTLNSSERYVSDACVLSDNRHLAAVTLGEADGVFASTLMIYAFDSEKPVSTTTLSGSMALCLGSVGKTLAALEDDRLTFFNADGSLSGSYRYAYPYLRGYSLGGTDFAVLLLSRYRSLSAMRVVAVSRDGDVLGTLDARREILDVSAAGRYIAVLYGDSMVICTSDMQEYATLANTDFAKRVVMRDDGTAMLISANRAWLFIP